MDKFKEFEKEFQEGSKRIIPVDKVDSNVEVLHVCSNPNFVWFNLNTRSSSQESSAMGHCGRDDCDTLFSLREKKFIGGKHYGWEPHITASFHEDDGRLSQVKGRENKKPKEKYHKYIIELLDNGIVNDFGDSSYLQENDFGWEDIPRDVIDRFINENTKDIGYGLVSFFYNNGYIDKIEQLVRNSLIDANIEILSHYNNFDEDDTDYYYSDQYSEKIPILTCASSSGYVDLVKLLIENGADVNQDYGSPLFYACRSGNVEIINILIENGIKFSTYKNPFIAAVENGNMDVIEILIKNGFYTEENLILSAAFSLQERNIELFEYLIEYIPDVTAEGNMLLKKACMFGNGEVLGELLDKIKDKKFDYETLFGIAIDYRNKECLKELIDRSVNIDKYKDEALVLACRRKNNIDIVKMLVEYGSDVNSNKGMPLYNACKAESIEIVSYLISKGATITGGSLYAALESAVISGSSNIIRILFENGADPKTFNNLFIENRKHMLSKSVLDVLRKNGVEI